MRDSGDSVAGERAVLSDDGTHIVLGIYGMRSAATLAAVELGPVGALRLAVSLAEAALRRLGRATPEGPGEASSRGAAASTEPLR